MRATPMKLPRLLASLAALGVAGCSSVPHAPVPLAEHVDLQRFMGDWYVIASIPTYFERDAWNAVESYRLDPDGSIATTFTYRQGGFDGPERRMAPRGFVVDRDSNAVWDMQFLWPIQAEYVIVDLRPDYQVTVIGRSKRDYVWLMARTPRLSEAELQTAISRIRGLGYDTDKLRMVPQSAATSPR